MINIRKR